MKITFSRIKKQAARSVQLLFLCLLFNFSEKGLAESRALIVLGTSADEQDAATLTRLASKTEASLLDRGLIKSNITVLSGAVTRELILKTVGELSPKMTATDDLWVVLYGHGGQSQKGQPSFQNRGPRMTAEDLNTALNSVPGHQYIFIGIDRSGGFLPYLKKAECQALSATDSAGEISEPRFPEVWVQAFSENPKASFSEIAARAAVLVTAEYKKLGLVQGEHARMLDGGTGQISEPPFGVDQSVALAPSVPATSSPPSGFSVNNIEIPKGNSEFESKPATDETRQLIEEVKKITNPGGYPVLILSKMFESTVNSDLSTSETTKLRIYLARSEGIDQWVNYSFHQDPPFLLTTIESGRIILPDATSLVLNPSKMESAGVNRASGVPSSIPLFFPRAQAGAIIELTFRTDRHAQLGEPAFYEEIELQQSVPVLQSRVKLKVPKNQKFKFQLKNIEGASLVSETEHSKVWTWDFSNLKPFEPLPLDPPRRDCVAWLGVSSLNSWDDFIAWFRRVSNQSDTIGAGVKQKASEISEANPERRDKIKAAFEFVSSFRYIAIEFGIHGFRPRSPEEVLHNHYGDCKDKANLLVALLRSMDIPADFVLLNRGSSTDRNFPGWQFNHAIAYVPGSDLWLDSTDTTTPFGAIPMGDFGRDALVFEGNGATFKLVKSAAENLISDEWTFEQQPDGKRKGWIIQKWTGLPDSIKRQELGGLSPIQRRFVATSELAACLPWADFSDLELSEPKDLKNLMSLRAVVDWTGRGQPVPGMKWLGDFAPLDRDRPVSLNDGQPLHYRQVVKGLSGKVEDYRSEIAGVKLSIHYEQNDKGITRIATCDIETPIISVKDYPAVRAALRDWSRRLEKDLSVSF